MITSLFCLILEINFKTNIPNQSPQLKLNDTYIESAKQIETTRQPRLVKSPKQKKQTKF